MPQNLYIKGTNRLVIALTESQLAGLRTLAKEAIDDRDFYIDEAVLDYLARMECDARLLAALTAAVKGQSSCRDPYRSLPRADAERPTAPGDGPFIEVELREE